jgi:hypothetical protein
MRGLLIEVCVIGTPNLDHFTVFVVPQVIDTQLLGEPIEPLTGLTDERKNLIVSVIRHVHLGIMGGRWGVRGHYSSLLEKPLFV